MELSGINITAELGSLALAIATGALGAVALIQYIKAERWKRLDFSIAQLNKLKEDECLSFCCQVIDWDCNPLIIPKKYNWLFPDGMHTFKHDQSLMTKALRPRWDEGEPEPDQNIKSIMLVYRYAFEEFLNYANVLAMYLEAGIIRRIDLGPVEYYLSRLNEINDPELGKIFIGLLKAYYSRRVLPWVIDADPRGVGTDKSVRFLRHYRRNR